MGQFTATLTHSIRARILLNYSMTYIAKAPYIAKAYQSIRIKKIDTHAGGFTLLELIGVMTIIAILTAAVLPSTIDLIQVQRSVNEGSKLPQVAEALKRGMLREQVFPIYQNGNSVPTGGNDGYWWNIVARHGGGSASEVRYPLGVSPGSANTRKLYFAQSIWDGKTFLDVTSDGTNWLLDPLDPKELRMLLLSTTGTDLPLPDTLSTSRFDALWDDWSIGSGGNPATGGWVSYGLNEADWEGRAAELNVQRIDLREWLSAVVIENRRAVEDPSGTIAFPEDWVAGSLDAYAENLVDSVVVIETSPAGFSGSPPVNTVKINDVKLIKRGKYIFEDRDPISEVPSIVVVGDEIPVSGLVITDKTQTFQLTLTDRAPISLLDLNNSSSIALSGWGITDPYLQNRYFLIGQQLLLGEPWNFSEVGTFIIDEAFSTLRFDGLQWEY
jgi:Tfp pilus assembly protein PilE